MTKPSPPQPASSDYPILDPDVRFQYTNLLKSFEPRISTMNTIPLVALSLIAMNLTAAGAIAGPIRTFEAEGEGQVLQSTGLPMIPSMASWSISLNLDPDAPVQTDGAPAFRDYVVGGTLTVGTQTAQIEALLHVFDSDTPGTPDEVSFLILSTEGQLQGDPGGGQELKFYDFSRASIQTPDMPTDISADTFETAFATTPGTNSWHFAGPDTFLQYEFLSIDSYRTVPAPGPWCAIGIATLVRSRRARR